MEELTIRSNAPGERVFMLGNEAIARGAIEAGVQVAAGYPGTPSSEILETLIEAAKDAGIYAEWSTNEKVAFEVAYGASMSGVKGLTCMKQIGINVASDSIKHAAFDGVRGGLVLVVADEPDLVGATQQRVQDTRYLAQRGYLPVLEPCSVQEAKDMAVDAFKLSEKFKHPFLFRTVTRISHGRGAVVLGEISKEKRQGAYIKKPPYFGRGAIVREVPQTEMYKRFQFIKKEMDALPYNRLKLTAGAKLGIIACGIAYSYVADVIGDLELTNKLSVLKIGTPYPLPTELVKTLLSSVEEVLVVEELEPFVELQIKALVGEGNMPVKIHGKDLLPMGELGIREITEAITKVSGTKPPMDYTELDKLAKEIAPLIPNRPSYLCAGCPHRASFFAITTAAKRVAGEYGEGVEPIYPADVGCYSMGSNPPLVAVDRDLGCSMGSSYGVGAGLSHTVKGPIIASMGDSTFFHAGISPLINAVFNKSKITMVLLDNAATAMTGFQPHPGTGTTAMGYETTPVIPEDIATACGVKFVRVVDPFDNLKEAVDTVEQALRFDGPSFVVFRRACAQVAMRERKKRDEEAVPYAIDQEKCSKCEAALPTRKFLFPCEAKCPANNDLRRCLDLIKQQKFEEALRLIKTTNPLPAVLGRVCYHPCEEDCNRGRLDNAVSIQGIERFLGDYGLTVQSKNKPAGKGQKDVAIIGSGPAGLSCAYYLATMGYGVTIFEALPVAGGMLAVGIPEYRLPKEVLRTEIKAIEDLGVEIRTETPIANIGYLLEQGYKAVFVAVGAHKNMKLGLPGEEKEGFSPALDFLRDVNLGRWVSVGDKVVIIGGGNVAIDSARVALRKGAKQVSILYRRSRAEMPARGEEIRAAEEEGIHIAFLVAPTRILGEGKVSGLECIRMRLGEPDASGRARPVPIESSQFTMDADTVISAIGEVPDLSFNSGELAVNPMGTLRVDANTLATSKPGVFAGGDAVSGPNMAAAAVFAGRKASQSIDRYIKGVPLEVAEEQRPIVRFEDLNVDFVLPAPRAEAGKLPVSERVKGFAEVDSGFAREAAMTEAQRCLACGVGSETCIQKLGCPAISRDNGKTIIDRIACVGCSLCAQICPYHAIVKEQNYERM